MAKDLLDLLEQGEDPELILSSAQQLFEQGEREKAEEGLLLAAMLAQEQENAAGEKKYLETLYRMDPTPEHRDALFSFHCRHLGAKKELLEKKVGKRAPGSIIGILHQFFPFAPGNYLKHTLYGTGQVTAFDIATEQLKVNFSTGERTIDFSKERKYLHPLSPESFLVRKETEREALITLAKKDPLALLQELLKEFKELKESEIKDLLQDLLGHSFASFWKRARREALTSSAVQMEKLGSELLLSEASQGGKNDDLELLFETASAEEKIKLLQDARHHPLFPSLQEKLEQDILKLPLHKRFPLIVQLKEGKLNETLLYEELKALSASQLKPLLSLLPERGLKEVVAFFLERSPKETLMALSSATPAILSILPQLSPPTQAAITHFYLEEAPRFPKAFFYCLERERSSGKKVQSSHLLNALALVESDPSEAPSFLASFTPDLLADLPANRVDSFHRVVSSLFPREDSRTTSWKIALHKLFPHLLPKEEWILYAGPSAIEKKREDLSRLEKEVIPQNREEIARARAYGDISENHEYKAAKEKQGLLASQQRKLEFELKAAVDWHLIARAEPIVTVGKKVVLQSGGEKRVIAFTGLWESDPSQGLFSYKTPLAEQLFGKKTGDSITLDGKEHSISAIEDLER